MKITIRDKGKIQDIQREFNDMFPYLKVEFFSRPHKSEGASARRYMLSPLKTLKECRTVNKEGVINITPEMTVSNLEQRFQHLYGLSVQVFRQSGKVWLETTVTDGWTLDQQNKEGKELSATGVKKVPENHTPEE